MSVDSRHKHRSLWWMAVGSADVQGKSLVRGFRFPELREFQRLGLHPRRKTHTWASNTHVHTCARSLTRTPTSSVEIDWRLRKHIESAWRKLIVRVDYEWKMAHVKILTRARRGGKTDYEKVDMRIRVITEYEFREGGPSFPRISNRFTFVIKILFYV